MIRLRCPTCEKNLLVKPELAGRLVLCPGCKTKLKVPAADAEPEAEPELEAEPEPRPKRPTSAISETEPEPLPRRRSPIDDDEDDAFDDDEPRPRRRKRKKKRRRESSGSAFGGIDPFFIIVGAIILVALAGLGVGLAFPPALQVVSMLGNGLTLVGGIWIIVLAFMEDTTQGILCLCVPCYGIYFAITNFDDAKLPLCIWIAGMVVEFASLGLMLATGQPLS
jgi:hypothetical protein